MYTVFIRNLFSLNYLNLTTASNDLCNSEAMKQLFNSLSQKSLR